MENKRKPGQPIKEDAKQKKSFRLSPQVLAIIAKQPNQVAYIERLVLADEENK